jgi:hypothetical protein
VSTLPSERIILAAPMSFEGSARRIWRLRSRISFADSKRLIWDRLHPHVLAARGWGKVGYWTALVTLLALAWLGLLMWYYLVVGLILAAWIAVLAWYCLFGVLLVPYRIIRRGQRRGRRDASRHRELLEQIRG